MGDAATTASEEGMDGSQEGTRLCYCGPRGSVLGAEEPPKDYCGRERVGEEQEVLAYGRDASGVCEVLPQLGASTEEGENLDGSGLHCSAGGCW